MHSSPLARGSILAAAVAASLLIGSCGNATARSAGRFCGELTAHATEIRTAPESADDIPKFITLFSKMGEVAPLDVQSDWEAVYAALKTANTVNVNDPASVQAVADAAYKSQRSAEKVVAWATKNCGVDLGPVGVVPGGADVIVTTTVVETTLGGG